MITAANITDEQIRELRSAVLHDQTPFEATGDREASAILHECDDALYLFGAPRVQARARCAEILNARAVCGHLVEQHEDGGKYQASCSCGWKSVRCRDLAASVAQANDHMGHYLDLNARTTSKDCAK